MKPTLVLLTLALAGATAQTAHDWTVPATLAPSTNGTPREYRFTCDYHNLDIRGHLTGLQRVSGRYTRGLPKGAMRWNDVSIAQGSGPETLGAPVRRDFMEGFTYADAGADMLEPDFFPGFPSSAMQERNLVWDTRMFEEFAHDLLTKLRLNVPYHVPDVENIALAGAGSFHHKDLQLTWTGITKRDGKECAVIDYRAFFNTLDVAAGGVKLIGRSDYWGQIWVSRADGRIEYATLYEEVLGELTLPGQDKPMPMSVIRIGVFEPVTK